MLAERSPEAIAAALARLYRSRLPAPEDIVDPGQRRDDGRARSRDDRGDRREPRPARGAEDGGAKPGQRTGFRRSMEGGSVWFRANIGRRKNAEARWLLPMICRRGGIDKNDIGAIRIYQSITEFEISAKAAENFAAKVQGPDKDDILIERLADGPRGEAPLDTSVDGPPASTSRRPATPAGTTSPVTTRRASTTTSASANGRPSPTRNPDSTPAAPRPQAGSCGAVAASRCRPLCKARIRQEAEEQQTSRLRRQVRTAGLGRAR